MPEHEDMVCLHGCGTYVTVSGLACARCGELVSRDDWHDDDERPDEWRKNDWDGWPEDTPNDTLTVSGGRETTT